MRALLLGSRGHSALRRCAHRIQSPSIQRRWCSSGPGALPEQEVLWPIVGGAVVVTGVLCGCALLRSDGQLRRAQGWLESGTRSGMTAETASTGWLIRFGLAFGLTQLPAGLCVFGSCPSVLSTRGRQFLGCAPAGSNRGTHGTHRKRSRQIDERAHTCPRCGAGIWSRL